MNEGLDAPRYLATMTAGLERLVWDDLAHTLAAHLIAIGHRYVIFAHTGPVNALVALRSVDDVFVFCGTLTGIAHTRAALQALQEQAARLQLATALTRLHALRPIPEQPSFAITASFVGARNYSRYEIADALGAGVQAHGWTYVANTPEAHDAHDIDLRVLLEGDQALVGLRLATTPLHRRAYKLASRPGSLKAPVAYVMALLAGIAPGQHALDPLCGVGTIALEAAALAWPARVLASDLSREAVADTRQNATGVAQAPLVFAADAAALPLASASLDAIVSNIPFGRQVRVTGDLAAVYAAIVAECARVLRVGGRAVLLTDQGAPLMAAARAQPLRLAAAHQISLFGAHPIIYVFERTAGNGIIARAIASHKDENMQQDVQAFIDATVAQAQPLWTALAEAEWGLATTGEERFQDEMQRLSEETMHFFAQPEPWAQVRAWHKQRDSLSDPLLRRQLELLYQTYAGNQRAPEQIARIAALEAELSSLFTRFRSTLDGREVPDNALRTIMRDETDSEARQAAWEASKQIGPQSAPALRELVTVRNAAAQALGWRDHYAMALELQEIDEDELFALLDDLEQQTREPFRQLKAELDGSLAARYQIASAAIQAWHYSDPFFQDPPRTDTINLDTVFADQDLESLTVRTFDGIGIDVRTILARSDMFERDGKDQHAFCTHIDRSTDDVRVLCNLRPDTRWMETSLHEFGHAIYDAALAPDLPYLLRSPAHTNTTEAVAMLMGRQARNQAWLQQVRGLSAEEAQQIAVSARAEERVKQLVFVRWALVMVYFERALYANPQRDDLNALWWEYVERFQLVPRPAHRDAPDWATKLHLAVAPVYYHNYILGELTASQLAQAIRSDVTGGTLIDNPQAGAWLRDRLFAPGAQRSWNDTLAYVTGERLSVRHFINDFVNSAG